MGSSLLFADEPDQISKVREALDRADYGVSAERSVIGEGGFSFLARNETAPVLRRTEGGSPLESLIRLFLVGVPVTLEEASRALAPLPVDAWAAAGLVATSGASVQGLVKLRPYEAAGQPWIVPYDSHQVGEHSADYVIGVGAASLTLAGLTVRPPVGRCLDLGTGCGVQAMHASLHAEEVVATDRNPRALAFATFAMTLNGIGNVTCREGDLFTPAGDERFGLIVSNPPFVVSPDSSFDYRDSGLPGDEICRRIVRQAPQHLEVGGWCQLLANWAHVKGEDWQGRLAGWFEGTGCDAWVIERETQDVEQYASTWIRHEVSDPASTGPAFKRWMDWYEAAGIEAVGFGLITMRRSDRSSPWLSIEELHQAMDEPPGEAIRASFARRDWLADIGDDHQRLLDARLAVASDTRLEESRQVDNGRWVAVHQQLLQAGGLRYSGSIDPQTVRCRPIRRAS
jgi:methylase of polypeptide subunit release factors